LKLSQKLSAVIEERHLLKHPFYEAWNKGELKKETLRRYAGQYWSQVSTFPRFVSQVHANCPELEARKVLLRNLTDEEIHGTDHPTLWMHFAQGLGATEQEVLTQTPLPKTQAMVDTFFELARSDWRDGLCALYAYESQTPAVSKSKLDGLVKHYGITENKPLAFFKVHLEYDVEHSQQAAMLIDQHCSEASAVKATERAADALWGFLDGIAAEAGRRC
jgi:pyrroloquinoline-quinone synthase